MTSIPRFPSASRSTRGQSPSARSQSVSFQGDVRNDITPIKKSPIIQSGKGSSYDTDTYQDDTSNVQYSPIGDAVIHASRESTPGSNRHASDWISRLDSLEDESSDSIPKNLSNMLNDSATKVSRPAMLLASNRQNVRSFLHAYEQYLRQGGEAPVQSFLHTNIIEDLFNILRDRCKSYPFNEVDDLYNIDSEMLHAILVDVFISERNEPSQSDVDDPSKLTSELTMKKIDEYCQHYSQLNSSNADQTSMSSKIQQEVLNSFVYNIQPLLLRQLVVYADPKALPDAMIYLRDYSRVLISNAELMQQVVDKYFPTDGDMIPKEWQRLLDAFYQLVDPNKEKDPKKAEDVANVANNRAEKLKAEAKKAEEQAKRASDDLVNAIKKAAEQEAQALKNVNDAAIRNAKENAERDLAKLKEDGERAKEAARQAKLVEEQEKERAAQTRALADSLLQQAKELAAKELDDAKAAANQLLADARRQAEKEIAAAKESQRLADEARAAAERAKQEELAAARRAKEEEKARQAKLEAERLDKLEQERKRQREKEEADRLAAEEALRKEAERKALEAQRKREEEERARELAKKKKEEMDALQAKLLAEAVKKQMDEAEAAKQALKAKQERESRERERQEALARAQRDEESMIAQAKAKTLSSIGPDIRPVDAEAVSAAMKSLPTLIVDSNFDDSSVLITPSSKRSQSPSRHSLGRSASRSSFTTPRGQSPMDQRPNRSASFSVGTVSDIGFSGEVKIRGYTPKLYTFGKLGFDFPQSPYTNNIGDLRCCSYRFCSCSIKITNQSPKANTSTITNNPDDGKSPEIRYLQELSSEVPSLDRISRVLEQLINLSLAFKCNKKSMELFASRLQRLATIITRLFKSYRQFNQNEVKVILDELGETLLEAKKYFVPFTRPGFTLALLKGSESKNKLDNVDAIICGHIHSLSVVFVATNDSRNQLQPVNYNQYTVIDESALTLAGNDQEALRALARLVTADIDDMVKDVPFSLSQLENMREEVNTAGVASILKHPAMRRFWRAHLNDVHKLPTSELVDVACGYIRHESATSDINEDDVQLIANKLHETLELLDESESGHITVCQVDQLSKHIDSTLTFVAVLERLWNLQTLRVMPPISYKSRDQIVWGATTKKQVQNALSAMSATCWTIAYGPLLSGKTYRFLQAAHEQEGKDATIWIDCGNVQTEDEFLSSIASQLSLAVLSLDDVVLHVKRLVEGALYTSATLPGNAVPSPKLKGSQSYQTNTSATSSPVAVVPHNGNLSNVSPKNTSVHIFHGSKHSSVSASNTISPNVSAQSLSTMNGISSSSVVNGSNATTGVRKGGHVSIVLDHVQLSKIKIYSSLFKTLKMLSQGTASVSVVIISTNIQKPSATHINDLVKCGHVSIPYSCVRYMEISPLQNEEALTLARYFGVFNADLVASASKGLPGRIYQMQNLRGHELLDIIDRGSTSMSREGKESPADDVAIFMDVLSNDEKLCAACLHMALQQLMDMPSPPYGTSENDLSTSIISQTSDGYGNNSSYISDASSPAKGSPGRSESMMQSFIEPPVSRGVVVSKAIGWELCRRALNGNIYLYSTCIEKLAQIGWLSMSPSFDSFSIPSSSSAPIYSYHPTLTIDVPSQKDVYYSYISIQCVNINETMQSKTPLLGCLYFDSIRKHLQALFHKIIVESEGLSLDDVIGTETLTGTSNGAMFELVSGLCWGINSVLDYRMRPEDCLYVSKAMLRVLCGGDDSGLLTDDRHFGGNDFRTKGSVVRGAVNFGWYLFRTNQMLYAEKVLTTALTHLSETDGANYAYALNKTAIVLRTLGRSEESLQMHEKCLWLRVAVLGESHPDTAQSLNNIAIVLNSLGHTQEALAIHERCLAIRIDVLGPKHVHTADTYYNMAGALVTLQRHAEAMDCFVKAREAYISAYGTEHHYVAEVDSKIESLQNEFLTK